MEVGQGPNWGCSAKEKKYGLSFNPDDLSLQLLRISEGSLHLQCSHILNSFH
jgi:hypothetical protein